MKHEDWYELVGLLLILVIIWGVIRMIAWLIFGVLVDTWLVFILGGLAYLGYRLWRKENRG